MRTPIISASGRVWRISAVRRHRSPRRGPWSETGLASGGGQEIGEWRPAVATSHPTREIASSRDSPEIARSAATDEAILGIFCVRTGRQIGREWPTGRKRHGPEMRSPPSGEGRRGRELGQNRTAPERLEGAWPGHAGLVEEPLPHRISPCNNRPDRAFSFLRRLGRPALGAPPWLNGPKSAKVCCRRSRV